MQLNAVFGNVIVSEFFKKIKLFCQKLNFLYVLDYFNTLISKIIF